MALPRRIFQFPNPVDEVAARTVAAGVVVMCALALGTGWAWILVPLAYGFWARVLTGPTLSPLGQLATRVIVPRLPFRSRPTTGPPKRFAQGMGTAFSTAALLLWTTAGWDVARFVLIPLLAAATLESVFGLCLGCRVFALLTRVGIVPDSVCEACADTTRRIQEGGTSSAQPASTG